ncbi:hypothetical protein [Streptomyces lavendulae]|uniref:hypothetical protein n=1 Tax=Streptomyces lavendulae TaxID=1914 RepID=UPI00382E0099
MAVTRALAANPGKAVTKAANAALNAGTVEALYEFLTVTGEAAQREDDTVATTALLSSDKAGPYTRAHAQAAMEGPAWLRRNFISSVQYKTAQLDCDSASHIAAMQGAIAAAANSAQQAKSNADAADQSAQGRAGLRRQGEPGGGHRPHRRALGEPLGQPRLRRRTQRIGVRQRRPGVRRFRSRVGHPGRPGREDCGRGREPGPPDRRGEEAAGARRGGQAGGRGRTGRQGRGQVPGRHR